MPSWKKKTDIDLKIAKHIITNPASYSSIMELSIVSDPAHK
jgi:hypothetical protein